MIPCPPPSSGRIPGHNNDDDIIIIITQTRNNVAGVTRGSAMMDRPGGGGGVSPGREEYPFRNEKLFLDGLINNVYRFSSQKVFIRLCLCKGLYIQYHHVRALFQLYWSNRHCAKYRNNSSYERYNSKFDNLDYFLCRKTFKTFSWLLKTKRGLEFWHIRRYITVVYRYKVNAGTGWLIVRVMIENTTIETAHGDQTVFCRSNDTVRCSLVSQCLSKYI